MHTMGRAYGPRTRPPPYAHNGEGLLRLTHTHRSLVGCVQDKADNLTNPACQEEVFYYQLMEVSDFRNDVILAEACRQDVEKYCKDVEPGTGGGGRGARG